MLRKPPPPPPVPPSSVLLLLAVGDLQREGGDDCAPDVAALAVELGVVDVDIPPLVARGVERGYLEADEDGDGVRLTTKGWAWYERHRDG